MSGKYKRLANTPPVGNNEKRVDQNSTPEALSSLGAVGGFDSSSLPIVSTGQSSGSTSTQTTTKSRVSSRLLMPNKSLDSKLIDGIPGQYYGGFRDVIEVEIVSIDGKPYTTNMRSSDAIRNIFMGYLDLDKNSLIGVQISWRGRPHIAFRVKEKIPIDSLPHLFTYEKEKTLEDGTTHISTIKCVVKGVRPDRSFYDDGTRTVTFEKCGWKITHPQIEKWATY